MGMFDYILFEMNCPTCGSKLDSFQSKDGDCNMEEIDAFSVSNFYDLCVKCGTRVLFHRKDVIETIPTIKRKLHDVMEKFELIATVSTSKDKG